MSSFAFSKKISGRYLWSKRSEAFVSIITVISVLGVAIGVMVLNIVMSVMTGFEHELTQKLVDADSHITLSNQLRGSISNWEDLEREIRKHPEVISVSPYTYHQVLLQSGSGSSGLLLKGISPDTPSAKQLEEKIEGKDVSKLFEPQPAPKGGGMLPGVVVGRKLAQSFALIPGRTTVSVISTSVGSTPFGLSPRYRLFLPIATYHSGLVEYESNLAYINIEEAQRFFRMGNSITGFEIRVNDLNDASRVAGELLDSVGPLQPGLATTDWIERNRPLWEALRLEKNVYFIVLLLIIVMASFSIVTTLIMIVLEKRKDIAIMKTMGASTKSIARIFQIHGSIIGALGTILGLFLGVVGCIFLKEYGFPLDERIFPVSTVPVRMEPLNFLMVGVAAFFICFFATVYPARRASQLEPSEILRYE